jgi:hypothetical protein
VIRLLILAAIVYRGFTMPQLHEALATVPDHDLASYDWGRFSDLQQAALEYDRCGPEGVTMWDDGGPWCVRWGWDGRAYR